MARIAGVDLPRDKRIEYALPYIYGQRTMYLGFIIVGFGI